MPTTKYEKLVRDKVPELMTAQGKCPVYEKVSPAEIPALLEKKLMKEWAEYLESHALEELADVVEVIQAILYHHGVSWRFLESLRLAKKEERGGFEGGIYLVESLE